MVLDHVVRLPNSREALDDAWNLRCVQLGGNRIRGPERNRAGGDRLPAAGLGRNGAAAFPGRLGARLAPGVRQLDAWNRALLFHESCDPGQAADMLVLPDAQVVRRDAPTRLHRGSLADHGRRPAHRPASQMHQVPIAGKAILGGILGHGGDGDPVPKSDAANGQWREEVRAGFHASSMRRTR